MHITDDLDRPVSDYNPILDNEVDIDAPYIDWDLVEDTEDIDIPNNGVYDTLYYIDEPILTVNQVSEIEIRFYTTVNPNENYRVGQRHIKGKVQDIKRVNSEETTNSGYSLKFDASKEWNGKISTVKIDQEYVDVTKTKCIAIIYFNEEGETIKELIIPIEEWFSPKVYLNSSLSVEKPDQYPFKVDDIVDTTIYIKEDYQDGNTIKHRVVEKQYTGRIQEISMVKREYTTTDENNIEKRNTIYYYLIKLDISKEYDYYMITIASTVIKEMTLHELPPEEP